MLNLLIGVCLAYVIALFAVAFGPERASMQGRALVAISDDLHTVAVDLLHRVDILRRRGLCGTIWFGVCHNLPWAQSCFAGVVVGFTKTGAHWPCTACHINCGFDLVSVQEIKRVGVLVTILAIVGTTPYIAFSCSL